MYFGTCRNNAVCINRMCIYMQTQLVRCVLSLVSYIKQTHQLPSQSSDCIEFLLRFLIPIYLTKKKQNDYVLAEGN